MSEKTKEQLEQEEAERKAAAKAQKEAKAKETAAAKEARAKERAEKKAAAEQAKVDAKAQKEAEKQAKLKAKEDAKAAKEAEKQAKAKAKADAKAAKEANRQPEQNGVRRPGPDGKCGQVWAMADKMSNDLGQAVPIANLLESAKAAGMNESNVRTEYARWKKFHGLTGRITIPTPQAAPAA
jgi:hypothetical protein